MKYKSPKKIWYAKKKKRTCSCGGPLYLYFDYDSCISFYECGWCHYKKKTNDKGYESHESDESDESQLATIGCSIMLLLIGIAFCLWWFGC